MNGEFRIKCSAFVVSAHISSEIITAILRRIWLSKNGIVSLRNLIFPHNHFITMKKEHFVGGNCQDKAVASIRWVQFLTLTNHTRTHKTQTLF